MGSFVFEWKHPAEEVYVTGTFDDWSKSEKLEKVGDHFTKNVTLSSASDKIYYKFVVDGTWTTDHTAPLENDASGNQNNVLTTDRIQKHTPETAGIMSTVGEGSTTAALAEKVPLEKSGSSDLPGAFPETPAAEKGDFSVNPLPAFEGAVNPVKLAPGEKVPDPSTLTQNTIHSNVKDDPELVAADKAKTSEQIFGVAPLPAFPGAVNPVSVAPGEKLPEASSVTGHTLNSNVTTDKESYENSGALGAPVLPPVVTPQAERDSKGTGVLDLPPISNTMIPESSLPMGSAGAGTYDAGPTIQSAGAGTTTAALAGAVPLESTKVPEVVKESQAEAGVEPEASAIPEEVKEKSAVEKELLGEVKEAPSTSEGTGGKETADKSEKGVTGVTAGEAAAAVSGAAVALGGAAAAYASGAASMLPESITSKLPTSIQESINSTNAASTAGTTAAAPVAPAEATPEVVKESIAESGQSPEAAANEQAVLEKKAVEKELLSEIKPETATGESAPTATGTTATKAPEPETSASPPAPKTEDPATLKALESEPATSETAPIAAAGLTAPKAPAASESRDVSPGTIPGSHTQNQTVPTVTSGVGSATTEPVTAAPVTPAKDAPATPAKSTVGSSKVDSPAASSTTTDKKNKRRSIFGKIKDKLTHKDKESK